MRQCIFVIATPEQVPELASLLESARENGLKYSAWVTAERPVDKALIQQQVRGSVVVPRRAAPASHVARLLYWAPVMAYRCFNYVHGVRMWTTKSPLIVVHGNGLSTWLASRAGRWGGGQLVHLQHTSASPPAKHHIMKKARFAFCDAGDAGARSSRYPGCTVVGVDVNDRATPQTIVESLLRWTGGKSTTNA